MEDVIKAPVINKPLEDKQEKELETKESVTETIDLNEKMTKTESDQNFETDVQIPKTDTKVDEKTDLASADSPSYATSDGGTDLFVSNSEFSSSASTPVPPEPFHPSFKVSISPNDVTKDGEVVKYKINSQALKTETEECHSVMRAYEDFEWLQHTLNTSNNVSGIIVPPLPPKIQSAVEKSKKQLGSSAKTLLKDEFGKDCRKLQKYLSLLAKHHLFGNEETFHQFLTHKDTPIHTQVKKGFLNKLSDAMKTRKYSTESDCEEFFLKERKSSDSHFLVMKASNDAFNKMTSSQLRLCEILNHLSTAFMLCVGNNETQVSSQFNKLNNLFSKAIKDSKDALETRSINDEVTLGAFFELYTDYLEAEKEMLFRRTCFMIEYENSNRALDKTKNNPVKYEHAVEHKKEAEQNFEQCSDMARQEIKRFHRERVFEFQQSLIAYCESRLRNARDTYTLLTATMTQLKQLKVPVISEPVE